MYEPLVGDDVTKDKTDVIVKKNDVTWQMKNTGSRKQKPGDVMATVSLPDSRGGKDQSFVILKVPRQVMCNQYNSPRALVLGALQVACGLLVLVLNVAAILVQIIAQEQDDRHWIYINDSFLLGAGIWGGALFCVSGGLAIASAKYKTKRLITGQMVFAILATVAATVLVIQCMVGFRQIAYQYRRGFRFRNHETLDYDTGMERNLTSAGKDLSDTGDNMNSTAAYHEHPGTSNNLTAAYQQHQDTIIHMYNWSEEPQREAKRRRETESELACCMLMLICGLIEFVICIWSSALSCRVTCCGGIPLGIAAAPASGEDVEQTKGAVYYKDHTTYPVYQPAHVLK